MCRGVPQKQESLFRDSLGASRRPIVRTSGKAFRVGLVPFGLVSIFTFASGALAADAAVGFRSVVSHFVLSGSTITNTSCHA
jgi:hypothetical protein